MLGVQTIVSVPNAPIVIGDDSGIPTLSAPGLGVSGIVIDIAVIGMLRRRSRVEALDAREGRSTCRLTILPGKAVEWATLDHRDTRIGPYRLRYRQLGNPRLNLTEALNDQADTPLCNSLTVAAGYYSV